MGVAQTPSPWGALLGTPAAILALMERTAWIDTFVATLQELRPHLKREFEPSNVTNVTKALAVHAYDRNSDPKVAARRYHAKQGPSLTRKRQ
jgi:hypothetical protein